MASFEARTISCTRIKSAASLPSGGDPTPGSEWCIYLAEPKPRQYARASGRRRSFASAGGSNPPRQVRLRSRRQRALARHASLRPAQAIARPTYPRLDDRGKEAEIDVHRLEGARAGFDRLD